MITLTCRIILLTAALWITCVSYQNLDAAGELGSGGAQAQEREVLYLPNGAALELMSFGYRNVLANLLWFNTINYFGKHFRSDHSYTWLKHMCGLVSTLDPKAEHVYEFCGMMLAWEGADPQSAILLLNRAIAANPQSWRFYYLRGMNWALFFRDELRAQADFAQGAKQPAAPPFMARLAVKTLANLDRPETAVAFLKEMIGQASDLNQKAALTEHLRKTLYEIGFQKLERARVQYRERHGLEPGAIEQLVEFGLSESDFADPFGGRYYIDAATGRIASTSRVERVKLFKK